MKCVTVIPTVTSYVVPTPTTLVQTEFPINATLRGGGGCYQTGFWSTKVFVLMGNLQKVWRDQQMTVQGGGISSWTVGRSCGSLCLVSITTGGDARIRENVLKKWSNVSLARQRPLLFLQNQLIPNKHPHDSLLGDTDRCSFESLSSNILSPASVLIMKANEMHYFSYLFDKVLCMFWTCPLSETCRVLYQINLRNSASHWLSL
jgi:hypothetical protein